MLGGFTAEPPRVHGDNGLGGVTLPEGPPAAPGLAADAIRAAAARGGPACVTLVGIGPATNLALALATEPALRGASRRDRADDRRLERGQCHALRRIQRLERPGSAGDPARRRPPGDARHARTHRPGALHPGLHRGAARAAGRRLPAACDILATVPPSRRLGGRAIRSTTPAPSPGCVRPTSVTHRAVHAGWIAAPGRAAAAPIIDRWGRLGPPPNARLLETLDAAAFFALLGERIASLP